MVAKISKSFVVLLALLMLTGCFTERYPVNMKGFTYANKLKYSNEFRIDGFYYMITGNNEFVPIIYFFDDGYYCFYTVDASIFASLQSSDCIRIRESMREIPYNWGSYIIENETIKGQEVNSYRGYFGKFEIQEQQATILNDSTICFFKKTLPGGKVMITQDTYHFRKCILKPSSINILMQELEKEKKKTAKEKK
jgi:hypothetical protein